MRVVTAYDEVPYDCQPIPCTAPEQLAVTALLHGGPCPPLRDARVLEIGCGDGANLLSLAFHRPDCRFVGVDASRVQIDDARSSALRLGLRNTALHAADVTEIGDELGSFDYILAHGVMSWVSDAVRDAIFAVCRDKLAPKGLLYLSYNTNPGWLARGLVRDVMLRSAGAHGPLRRRAGAAVARADSLRLALQESDHPYAQLMSRELARVHQGNESYLIHDYLAEHNRPFWFRDFASLAAGFGFRYLAEAAFTQPDYRVPPEISECAASLESDPLEIEGLIDVLWYRQHRASLFCRRDQAGTQKTGAFAPDRLHVASGLQPGSDVVSLDPGVPETFSGCFEPDLRLERSDPATKAALVALSAQWPHGLPWERLLDRTGAILKGAGIEAPSGDGGLDLWGPLCELHALGQVELRLIDLPARREPSETPAATPLTRWEAERRAIVTTATHQRLALTQADRLIVQRLDGRIARATLVATVVEKLRSKELCDWNEDELGAGDGAAPLTPEQWAEDQLDRNVALLAAWGLLS
jgi:SAM-dependent methyltransferase